MRPAAGSSRQSSTGPAHRARDFEPPLGAVGQVAGGVVGAVEEANALEPMHGPLHGLARGGGSGAPMSPSSEKPEARISARCWATIRFSSTVMPGSRMFWNVRDAGAAGDLVVRHALQEEEVALAGLRGAPAGAGERGERLADAGRVGEHDAALGRFVEPGDAVEDGGLAGAVGR